MPAVFPSKWADENADCASCFARPGMFPVACAVKSFLGVARRGAHSGLAGRKGAGCPTLSGLVE
eukprot:5914259-Pyramimonas_sp.AAC.1